MSKICPNCKKQTEDHIVFCLNCGCELPDDTKSHTLLENPVREQPAFSGGGTAKKLFPVKAVAAAAIVLAAVLALAMAFVCLFSDGDIKLISKCYTVNYMSRGVSVLTENGEEIKVAKDDIYVDSTTNFDGSKLAILTRTANGKKYVLYYFDGGKAMKVDEFIGTSNIYSTENIYRFSADGKSIAYINGDGAIKLFSTNNKKSKEIAPKANRLSAISPDGKTVAYNIYSDDGNTAKNFLCIGGKNIETDENCGIIAVANGAKYLYYIKGEESRTVLYVKKSDNVPKKISNDFESSFTYLNMDLSQILYTNINASGSCNLCISNEGGDMQVIYDGIATPILPSNIRSVSLNSSALSYINVTMVGFKDFKNMIFGSGYAIYRVNSSYKADIIINNIKNDFNDQYTSASHVKDLNRLSDNGKILVYINDGKVYKADLTNNQKEPVIIYDGGADKIKMEASDDCSAVCLSTSTDEIYYSGGNSKAEKLMNAKFGWNTIILNKKSGTLFCAIDDKLYYYNKNNNGLRELKNTDGLRNIDYSVADIIYYKNGGDFYWSDRDGNVKKAVTR